MKPLIRYGPHQEAESQAYMDTIDEATSIPGEVDSRVHTTGIDESSGIPEQVDRAGIIPPRVDRRG